MKDEYEDLSNLARVVHEWKNDRDEFVRIMAKFEESQDHVVNGQNRIFGLLGTIDSKLGDHGERIVRASDMATIANEKIDKHKEDHWKSAALNVSIVGMMLAAWKWLTGKQ